jgi:Sulfotransferase domain
MSENSIRVIGAGLGRTGTNSLREALEVLDLGPCYHMFECLANGDAPAWILAEQTVRQDCGVALAGHFDKLFHNESLVYRSCAGCPAAVYYKELLKAYPDAKVVLTVRDSADEWYESARNTIATAAHWRRVHAASWLVPKMWHVRRMLWDVIWGNPRLFNGNFSDAEAAKKVYNDWIKQVKEHVPEDQLLVYNVKEGWEPLCNFLGVNVPGVPFPRGNDTEQFQKALQAWFASAAGGAAVTAAAAAAGVAVALRVRGGNGGAQ